MIQKITLSLLFLCNISLLAQINEAPYILTVDELKNWTQNGPTADASLIASEDLAARFVNTDTQFNSALTNNLEIAYLPDGMNNFANYGDEQGQFNLYNFTNWSYIDKLVWFGGTADQTVQLPSAPWVNTAHKNGVEVFGNIFFAPNAFGGSTATMLNFLEQDGGGNFIVIPILVDIMEYYNFDGWFINEETSTNSSTGQLMYEFLRDLTQAVEAEGKEVMWYDAMLLNGSVNWQNRLTANNSVFVQNDEDNNSGNGFEQRVSSSIFINFFWTTNTFPNASRTRATTIGRSEYEVFTGVDVWPGRNQAPFQSGGNNWMSLLHENPITPYTSMGLFAPNCVYNNSIYSNFNNDPNDYANFYSEERHMFAGADRNPAIEDASGFKGYANWIPATSTIDVIPFETNFNTGHGLKKFTEGTETSANPWHYMNDQNILPTWQFAFSENNALSGRWDFDSAYNGGSSLLVEGDLDANTPVDLTMYKTKLNLTADSKIDIVFHQNGASENNISVLVTFADAPSDQIELAVASGSSDQWHGRTVLLDAFAGRELATIGIRFEAATAVNNLALNVGNLKVHNGLPLSVDDNAFTQAEVIFVYPTNSNQTLMSIDWQTAQELSYEVYSIDGKRVLQNTIPGGTRMVTLPTANFSKGMYVLKMKDGDNQSIVKKFFVR